MRLNFNKCLAITAALLCFSNVSLAGTVMSCADAENYRDGTKDFGDATTSSKGGTYGQACHETNAWQQLGKAKDLDSGTSVDLQGDSGGTDDSNSENRGWDAAATQDEDAHRNGKDQWDNGVRWSVKKDGVYGKYGTPELTQGQAVQFRFRVTRSDEGNHLFDELKVWVDWNGQDGFNNNDIGTSGSEILYNAQWDKERDIEDRKSGDVDYSGDSANYNDDVKAYNNKDTYREYIFDTTIPMTAMVGETWMRARIVCENSLTLHTENMNLTATGYQDQGEVEDYKLKISQVPEPTTLLVFGSALMGLVLSRKKVK